MYSLGWLDLEEVLDAINLWMLRSSSFQISIMNSASFIKQ